MKKGDLVQSVFITRSGIRFGKPRLLGVLLEDPVFPRYGNVPKRYKVLRLDGRVDELADQRSLIIEAVSEAG